MTYKFITFVVMTMILLHKPKKIIFSFGFSLILHYLCSHEERRTEG